MGKFEFSTRLTAVRRPGGQDSMGPSDVRDQSFARTTLPISPPPVKDLSVFAAGAIACLLGRRFITGGGGVTGGLALRGQQLVYFSLQLQHTTLATDGHRLPAEQFRQLPLDFPLRLLSLGDVTDHRQ